MKKYQNSLICLLLIVSTLLVYWQIGDARFIQLDDYIYVVENTNIRGLNSSNLLWAFTSTHAANWHPVTWISLMIDAQIFGPGPSGFHITNLLLHILSTLLIFFVLTFMTKHPWKSAFVAGLFALHPLHVESVAWIAERKDVLSACFGMATIGLYARYIRDKKPFLYVSMLACFALGLMAKPMLVTLPCLLLLLDYWPLNRFRQSAASGAVPADGHGQAKDRSSRKKRGAESPQKKATDKANAREGISPRSYLSLITEKIPMFILSAASCMITYYAQQKGGSVMALRSLSFPDRIINGIIAYAGYMEKMIWPKNLAIFYPIPSSYPIWEIAAALAVLIFVTAVVLVNLKTRPYLATGWFWYLGTLVPVIGLVQVGSQAMADRYTYIPLIGLFIIIAWGIPDLIRPWKYRIPLLATSGTIILTLLACMTWFQVDKWKNDLTLFGHAVQVTQKNVIANFCLGDAYAAQGNYDRAIQSYREALRIEPQHPYTHNNLGIALQQQGHIDEATVHYRQALQSDITRAKAYTNLGFVAAIRGHFGEAIENFHGALQTDPEYLKPLIAMGDVLATTGKFQDALAYYTRALSIGGDLPDVHYNMGVILAHQGSIADAVEHLRTAIRIKPDFSEAHRGLGNLLLAQGRRQEAIVEFQQAAKSPPPPSDGLETHPGKDRR